MTRSRAALDRRKLYNKYGWADISRNFLGWNPYCFWCGEPSQATDHIVAHRGDHQRFINPRNWQPLCNRCHNLKSWGESNGIFLEKVPSVKKVVVFGRFMGLSPLISTRTIDPGMVYWGDKFPFLKEYHGISHQDMAYRDFSGTTGFEHPSNLYQMGVLEANRSGCWFIFTNLTELESLRRMTHDQIAKREKDC